MSFDPLDPNRYAAGAEAASVLARAEIEQADVDIATRRKDHAEEARRVAEQRFREAEAAFKLCKAVKEEASNYERQAIAQLDVSAQRLALVKALLHPVRKTPLEVLGHIFVHCLDFYPPVGRALLSDKSSDVLVRQRQPFQLAAVCRRWRQASCSYAPAWSTLDLQFDSLRPDSALTSVYMASTIIERSAQVPMHIRLYRSRASTAIDHVLAQLLEPVMTRCKSLCISTLVISGESDAFASILACRTPLLDTLQLKLDPSSRLGGLPGMLPEAPNLRDVWTTNPFSTGTRRFPKAASVTLQTPITMDAMRRDDLSVLQKACPNLSDLILLNPRVGPCIRLEPCVLNVPVLDIMYSRHDGDLIELAGQFAFPRIRSLRLYGSPEGSGERIAFLTAVLPQCKTLNKLTISTIWPADFDAFCAALSSGENLGSLTIRKFQFTHESLRKLCNLLGRPKDGGAAWVCPALKTLELSTCTLSRDSDAEDLFQLVARRLAAADNTADEQRPARLRSITLPCNSLVARVRELFANARGS